ncbi:MAG: lytic transglycosylase domain-containing protein [Thiohalocapsa sp.]
MFHLNDRHLVGLRGLLIVAMALAVPILNGCAGGERADPDFERSEAFPLPAGLEDAVTFWRNAYAKWSRNKVIIHDDRHLALVYQIADLPGPMEESYTSAQKEFVRDLKDAWSSRLASLERKVRERGRLKPAEKELKNKIDIEGAPGALYGASDRVRSQRGVRERFHRGLENSGAYEQTFREVFHRHGLPDDLSYLPHVESSFQLNARSSVGASGMWQFMPATGRQFMTVNSSVDQRLDPVVAADAAARYLKNSYSSLRSWPLALTSYNHGLGGMKKAQARYGNDMARIAADYDGRYFGFASRNFYAEFLAARHVARNGARYFPEGVRYRPPLSDQPVVLRDSVTVDEIARHYRVPRTVLTDRNYAWLRPVRNGSRAVPAGTTIWLPQGVARFASGQPRSSTF